MTQTAEFEKTAKLVNDIKIAMLTTIDADGQLVARPMSRQEKEFDGTLWFFAERNSRKLAHIKANPHVGVTLTSNDTWISIDGTAEIVDDHDRIHELWNAGVSAWLPQGPDDDSVALIKVTGHSAEYLDSPLGKVASAVSFVKAKITGERFKGAEKGSVTL